MDTTSLSQTAITERAVKGLFMIYAIGLEGKGLSPRMMSLIAATGGAQFDLKRQDNLTDALAGSQLFPEDFLHMVSVAESSGTVPEALQRLSPQFEDQARRSLAALTAACAWLIWALVATFIVFIIFRIFSFYAGMINQAAQGAGL